MAYFPEHEKNFENCIYIFIYIRTDISKFNLQMWNPNIFLCNQFSKSGVFLHEPVFFILSVKAPLYE
jgi:hypothetical protein